MTDLERRALLGDRQAQEECTWRGIVLPCPFCGNSPITEDNCVFCGVCGLSYEELDAGLSLHAWNTRPAPPIGRCGECEFHDTFDCPASKTGYTEKTMKYCSWFEPNGGEEK